MPQTISVQGMSCDGCESAVESAIGELSGVTDVTADHEAGSVTIEGSVSMDDVTAAVEEAGYETST